MFSRVLNGSWGNLVANGTVPTSPTIDIVDNGLGTGAIAATVADSSTTIKVYTQKTGASALTLSGTAIATGVSQEIELTLGAGSYTGIIISEGSNSLIAFSPIDKFYVISATAKDAARFYQLVMETLAADSIIQSLIARDTNGNYMVVPSKFVPVGNVYPQITVSLDFKDSEPKFPAGYYNLMIRLWFKDDPSQQFSKTFTFKDAIDSLFNREGNEYNIINIASSYNLRVASILRRFGEVSYERDHNKYYIDYRFDCVLSEDESFTAANAGDKSWV